MAVEENVVEKTNENADAQIGADDQSQTGEFGAEDEAKSEAALEESEKTQEETVEEKTEEPPKKGMSDFDKMKMFERKMNEAENDKRMMEQRLQELEKKVPKETSGVDVLFEKIKNDQAAGVFNPDDWRSLQYLQKQELKQEMISTVTPLVMRQTLIETEIGKIKNNDWFEPKVEPFMREALMRVDPNILMANPDGVMNEAYDFALGKYIRSGGTLKSKEVKVKKVFTQNPQKIESAGVSHTKSSGKSTLTAQERETARDMGLNDEDYIEWQKGRNKKK